MRKIAPVAEQGMFSNTENFAAHLAGKVDDLIEVVNDLQGEHNITRREKDLIYHAALLACLDKAAFPEKDNTAIIDGVVNFMIKHSNMEI